MAVKVGKLAKITVVGLVGTYIVYTYVVSEQGQYSLSGFSRDALDSTAFGDDVKEFTFGVADGGEITFSGNYDPADTNGQLIVDSACINASVFTGGDMRFYIDSTSYLTVNTGGNILITKCRTVGVDKVGLATISFTGKISGKSMIVI